MTAPFIHSPIEPTSAEMHLYDVLVAGAGPAGSAAAYHLAHSGANVLLVDRHVFPREKSCGDALMPPTLDELARMGLVAEVQQRYALVNRVGTWFDGLPGHITEISGDGTFSVGYVAPRASFDALLVEHALHAGASWLDRLTVLEAQPQQEGCMLVRAVKDGQPVQLRSRLVIAADGSGSRLARQLSLQLHQQGMVEPVTLPLDDRVRYTAMRGYYQDIRGLDETLEFYFRAEEGTHYYWIFPMRDGLYNVGVIASMQQLRAASTNLEAALENFLNSGDIAQRMAQATLQGTFKAAPIAAGLRGTALYGERMLVAGDAAALVHPQSAEGISGALFSGRVAAEVASTVIAKNDYTLEALKPYADAIRARYLAPYESLIQRMPRG